MGNVTSNTSESGGGGSPYLRDQTRFSIAKITVTNSRNKSLLQLSPNEFPATRYLAKRESVDDFPVEYIQDPDASPNSPPSFLLRLQNDDDLILNFTINVRQGSSPSGTPVDTVINGLTFIFAGNTKDLDNLITKELHADPNLHKNNPNVQLVGDYSTAGDPVVQFHWTWKWRPPRSSEGSTRGWRTCCSFVEYDQRNHRLDPLATFAFWVNASATRPTSSHKSPGLRLEAGTSRLRVPSAQSMDSRISDSDGGETMPRDGPFGPTSPSVEPIFEDQMTANSMATGIPLEPSVTGTTAASAIKLDIAFQRPGENDVTTVDDGPLFRATMKSMEAKTGSMKSRWKKVLKRAEAAHEAAGVHCEAMLALTEALREAAHSNANAVRPALEHYFDGIAAEMIKNETQNRQNLTRMVIDPISRLYHSDIKAAEAKKRDFDEESKEYYAFVGRYLGQRSDSLKEKKRAETDSKYQMRRRNFELKRFDYSSYLQDLHGGRKDQEVLSKLTQYADAQTKGYMKTAKKIEDLLPQLEALNSEVREADKELQLHRTEREEKRRALEKSAPSDKESALAAAEMELAASAANQTGVTTGQLAGQDPGRGIALARTTSTTLQQSSATGTTGAISNVVNGPGLTSSVSQSNKFKGIRDLEEPDPFANVAGDEAFGGNGPQRKEGLVWALSRPQPVGGHHGLGGGFTSHVIGSSLGDGPSSRSSVVSPLSVNNVYKPGGGGWHKFWIVLDGGKLSEYTNWKQKLDLHMEPIDLRVASVREARNADRRFCWEVITPQFTRTYQATSEDDMKSWIATVNNALQSAVEDGIGRAEEKARQKDDQRIGVTGSTAGDDDYTTGTRVGGKKDFASALTGKSNSQSHHRAGNKVVGRHATVGDRPSQRSFAQDPTTSSGRESHKLLQQIRTADQENRVCADCGSENKVDWVSINLGVIICIECSGIHRSLGTHVSKVRSLTLDPNAFTMDVVDLLMKLGNRKANTIWEASLDPSQKLSPGASRDQRLKYVSAKYGERAYVLPLSGLDGKPSKLSHYNNADDALLASVKMNELEAVAHALALGANPNIADKSRGTHVVFLAIAASDPASPQLSPDPAVGTDNRKAFPVAEMLLLNGADVPNLDKSPIPISKSGRLYLDIKAELKSGRRQNAVQGVQGVPPITTAQPDNYKGTPRVHRATVSTVPLSPPQSASASATPSKPTSIMVANDPAKNLNYDADVDVDGIGTGGDMLTALPVISNTSSNDGSTPSHSRSNSQSYTSGGVGITRGSPESSLRRKRLSAGVGNKLMKAAGAGDRGSNNNRYEGIGSG